MKKTLIALSILGLASSAAMAQTSDTAPAPAPVPGVAPNQTATTTAVVNKLFGTGESYVTLYGVADIALGKAASTGDKKVGAQSNSIVTNQNSQIGLRGREDLGGGLSVGFNFEAPVDLATGANDSSPASFWSRGANVSLHSAQYGALYLGREWSPSFVGQYLYELTHYALYSVVMHTYGFGANVDPWNNAQIKYVAPVFAGLSGSIAYTPKADGGLLDGGAANSTDKWDATVVYASKSLLAAITVNKTGHPSAGALAADPYYGKVNWTVGGQYRFGNSFAVAASYNRANAATNFVNSINPQTPGTVTGRRYGFELGGSAFFGPFTVTLDLTRDTKSDLYVQSNGRTKKYTNGVLEGKYTLSKRTFLYAAYLRLDGENNYGVGISHSF